MFAFGLEEDKLVAPEIGFPIIGCEVEARTHGGGTGDGVSAGALADQVFGPLLVVDGFLADNIGTVIGVGPGRGIGLLFMVMGALVIIASILGYLHPRIRRIEDELPDAN